MPIGLLPATLDHLLPLANLMQLSLHDRSEYNNSEVTEGGVFLHDPIDPYLTDPDRHAFMVLVDGQVAGFALVGRQNRLRAEIAGHSMDEFFILRKYRRRRVGTAAALEIFARFPGRWEVYAPAENVPGQAFWRSAVQEFTGGRYTERWLRRGGWNGAIQVFEAPQIAPLQSRT